MSLQTAAQAIITDVDDIQNDDGLQTVAVSRKLIETLRAELALAKEQPLCGLTAPPLLLSAAWSGDGSFQKVYSCHKHKDRFGGIQMTRFTAVRNCDVCSQLLLAWRAHNGI